MQVTVWFALTNAPIECCMEAIPASHREGQLHHGQSEAPHNLLSRRQTVSAELDTRTTVFMPVRAGEMSLHPTHLVHRSGPNRSDDCRIGLGISYIPTHVRCLCGTRLTAMLVRGVDRYGHFDDEPRPQADYGAAERAFHAEAVARFREANREQTLRYEIVWIMGTRFWLALIGLLLSIAAAGCAATDAASDNDKRGVLYGGVSAGGARP